MIPIFKYLQYLTFISFNNKLNPDFATQHAYAFKSDNILPFCNRVCATSQITPQEIHEIMNFFNATPFRWFVQDTDSVQIQLLENNKFRYICSFPAMQLDLAQIKSVNNDSEIIIKEVVNDADMEIWISIVSRSYGMTNPPEFAKFIHEIKQRAGKAGIRFYCGFYQNTPISVSFTLMHDDVVGLHWVGTLPEYRNKGAGLMVSLKPLLDARERGYKTAILFASEMGKSVYERLGFKEYATYKVYGL